MTRGRRREYATVERELYRQVTRAEKRQLLDEVVAVTGIHRKAAIPLLHRAPRPQVLGELKLTDGHKAKIKPIAEEMAKKVEALRAGAVPPDRQAMQQIRQEYVAKVKAIVRPEQKAAIETWRKANPVPRPGGNPPK